MLTRAELEAKILELEEKRDRLQALIEQEGLLPGPRPEGRTPVPPTAILEITEKVMKATQPILGMLVSERESLIAECEAARRGNDPAVVKDATEMLDFLNSGLVEFSENAARLNALAEGLRARITSDARAAVNEDEAG